jgi:rhomboid protease GluP
MSIEQQEEDWIDVGTYSTLDEAQERALVALSMGEAIRVEHGEHPGEFDLQVEPDAVGKISEEIRQYEAEFELAGAKDTVLSGWAKHAAGWPFVIVWVMALVTVFHFQQSDPGLVTHGASSSIGLLQDGEWWRPFTALFLHGDAAHIIGNLASGAVFSILVSKSIGPLWAWILIFLSGTVGNTITSIITYPESFISLGASTAVFGALGILSGIGLVENFRETVRMPWLRVLGPLLAGLILLGWLGGAAPGSATDVFGHVFGFSAGVVAGIVCRYFVSSETLQDGGNQAT